MFAIDFEQEAAVVAAEEQVAVLLPVFLQILDCLQTAVAAEPNAGGLFSTLGGGLAVIDGRGGGSGGGGAEDLFEGRKGGGGGGACEFGQSRRRWQRPRIGRRIII